MPTRQEILEDARKRVISREAARPNRAVSRTDLLSEAKVLASKVDPEFDYSGVNDTKLRFGLASMDTREEQELFLSNKVGDKGFTRDRFDRLALTPKGLDALNIKHSGNAVIIDEPGLSGQDLVDLSADTPAIVGGVVGGVVGTVIGGPVIGAEFAGMGAAGGKRVGEAIEERMGLNIQPSSEVARDSLAEFPLGVAGEGVAGVAGAIGRKALAPEAKRITQETMELVGEAKELGTQPTITQITKAPIIGRTQNMLDLIFGNPVARRNEKALRAEMSQLKTSAGPRAGGKLSLGENIVNDVRNARNGLSRWAKDAYGEVDELAKQNNITVPTTRLKEAVQQIKDELVTNPEGDVILSDKQILGTLEEILSLGDSTSFRQMQRIRNRLFNSIGDDTLVPGLSSRDARTLWKSANKAFDDISKDENVPREFRELFKSVDKTYKKEIAKFDDAYINRIMRSPKKAGNIDPELIVESAFKKGNQSKLNRLFRVLPEATKKKVRRSAMEDLLDTVTKSTEDPLIEIFQGKNFLDTLDAYGRDTLSAMFGPELTNRMYKFGRVTKFVNQRMSMSGGLVAANLALHPWQNLGRIVKLRFLSQFMSSDNGIKWLTEGLDLKNTRRASMALTRITAQANMLSSGPRRPVAEQEEQ